jgi:outer membrane usher protein
MHLKFDVKRVRGATLSIRLEDNRPMPQGATAVIAGSTDESPVGMGGELYLTGLAETNVVRVTWRGQQCELIVPYAATITEPLPDLGAFTCKGIKP